MKIQIHLPTKVNVNYGYNGEKNRFNCPWENRIEIMDYNILGDANLDVRISDKSYSKVVEDIINFYRNCKFTSGISIGQNYVNIIIQEGMLDSVDQFGGRTRGHVESYFPDAKIRISISECRKTIERDEPEFHQKYPEFSDHKWTLNEMIVYVLAHEIGHLFSPELLHGPGNYLGEIIAILYGSKFAYDNNYIFVPQGRFLKDDWSGLGIELSSKDSPQQRNYGLKLCEEKIRQCLLL